jgi:hypothetical protein
MRWQREGPLHAIDYSAMLCHRLEWDLRKLSTPEASKKFSMAKSNGLTSMRSKAIDVPVCDATIWKPVDVNDET